MRLFSSCSRRWEEKLENIRNLKLETWQPRFLSHCNDRMGHLSFTSRLRLAHRRFFIFHFTFIFWEIQFYHVVSSCCHCRQMSNKIINESAGNFIRIQCATRRHNSNIFFFNSVDFGARITRGFLSQKNSQIFFDLAPNVWLMVAPLSMPNCKNSDFWL